VIGELGAFSVTTASSGLYMLRRDVAIEVVAVGLMLLGGPCEGAREVGEPSNGDGEDISLIINFALERQWICDEEVGIEVDDVMLISINYLIIQNPETGHKPTFGEIISNLGIKTVDDDLNAGSYVLVHV